MVRTLGILVAVAAGATCLLLLVAGPTVQGDRGEVHCPGVIAGAEGGYVPEVCRAVQTRWTWYAAGAGLVSLAAGTGVYFRSPRRTEAPDTPQESIDNR